MWIANPSSYGTLIHYFPPVFTGAPNLLKNKKTKALYEKISNSLFEIKFKKAA